MHIYSDYIKELGHAICGGWQVQNLQNNPAVWSPKKELMLQLESEGDLQVEFPLPGEGGTSGICL